MSWDFQLPMPFHSRLRVRRGTDGQTVYSYRHLMPPTSGVGGIKIWKMHCLLDLVCYLVLLFFCLCIILVYVILFLFFQLHLCEINYKNKSVTSMKKATANRSLVSIRGRPCKICLASSLITMQNLVVVSHTECTHAGGFKNLGTLVPHPLGRGRG